MQICTPPPKKSPKKPNQKWAKCCMKATIRQVFLKTSLFIVHFSKRYLKTSSWTYFMKNQLQINAFVAFVKSLSSVLSTSSLSTATWQKPLYQSFWLTLLLCSRRFQNATSNDFLLYRVVISKALWIWQNAHFF